jgi:DNA-binding beta-propeller fold protein YncE
LKGGTITPLLLTAWGFFTERENMGKRSVFSYIILLWILIIVACSRDLTQSTSVDDLVIFPPPPDTTRIQFLTSISTSQDIEGKQSNLNRFLFGESTPISITKPYGITVHKSKIYICDTGLGGLIVIDLVKRSFVPFVPSGKGQLKLPLNCFLDDRDYLYVADGNRRQVVIFDEEGKYYNAFGETENFKPTDVAVFDNKIFVASLAEHRINIYNRDSLKLITSFPDTETGDPAYLYQPANIYIAEKEVYVSDMGEYKIKIFSHNGEFLRSVGGYGNNFGQLMRPKGIAVDTDNNLFVVDAAFENVQIFNKTGNLLMYFGGPYSKPGDMWLPAGIALDNANKEYFSRFVDESFELKYLIFVANQYGPDKIGVYGFVKPKK